MFDDQPSTSKPYDCGAVQSKKHSFHLFSVFCVLLPFGLLLLFMILIHTCRPKIHSLFVHTSPVSNINQNFAALILTGIVFSVYVLVCDGFAVYHASRPVDKGVNHSDTLPYVITILIIDSLSTLIAVVNIFILALNKQRSKLMMYCASCFVRMCFLRQLKYHKIDGNDQYNYLSSNTHSNKTVEEMNHHENILHQEKKLWLLLVSFVAPIACIGTHASFVIMAWSSDLAQATSITVVFIISFIYYFLGFRQVYIMFSLGPFIQKVKYERTVGVNVDSESFLLKTANIQSPSSSVHNQLSASLCVPSPSIIPLQRSASDTDLHSHAESWTDIQGEPKLRQTQNNRYICVPLDHEEETIVSRKDFNFKVLLCELLAATLILSAVEILTVTVYIFLPAPVSTVPTNVLNLLHLTLLVGGGLVAYKLLTFQTPTEQVLLKSILDSYNPNAKKQGSSENDAKRLGAILGNLLKNYKPRRKQRQTNDKPKIKRRKTT